MTTKLELWLVRHGETTANASRRISGWTNVQLSEAGKQQAAAIRNSLTQQQFCNVWSSSLQRAMDTAAIAYGTPVTDDRLMEMNFGEMENLHWETADSTLTQALLEFKEFQAPGGENLVQFRQRLLHFIDELSPGRHLIFTHGGVIRMLTHELGLDRFIPNAGIAKINWTEQTLIGIEEI